MSNEELLKDRRKVTGPYPGSPYQVGTILVNTHVNLFQPVGGGISIDLETVNKCGNLFQPLKWWECRKIEELPKYVKTENNVYKLSWRSNKVFDVMGGQDCCAISESMSNLLPATKSDYEAYINSKNK